MTTAVVTTTGDIRICPIHRAEMRVRTKGRQRWFSHRLPDGSWCSGEPPAAARLPRGLVLSDQVLLDDRALVELDELIGMRGAAGAGSNGTAPQAPAAPEIAQAQPAWLCEVTGEPVAFAVCLACAQAQTRPACPSAVPAILTALKTSRQVPEEIRSLRQVAQGLDTPMIRATGLLGCVRKAWFQQHTGRPLELPSAHWARLRGTIFHQALADMANGTLAETRLSALVDDGDARAIISGQIDDFVSQTGLLTDYKTTNAQLHGNGRFRLPQTSHVRQLWVYQWLLVRNGYGLPAAARIVYMNMRAIRPAPAPLLLPDAPAPGEPFTKRQPTISEWEGVLAGRAKAILAAEPPDPQPDESWECGYCPYATCPLHPQGHGRGKT